MKIQSNSKQLKIVLFGGAFSPFHFGHLKITEGVLTALKPNFFYLIPYKEVDNEKKLIPNYYRFKLIQMQIEKLTFDFPETKIIISDYEINKNSKSYSYLTCKYFRDLYPKAEIYFVLGSDALKQFYDWKKPNKILACCHLIHLRRKNDPIDQSLIKKNFRLSKGLNPKNKTGQLINLKADIPTVSSTLIKSELKQLKLSNLSEKLKIKTNKNHPLYGYDTKVWNYLLKHSVNFLEN